MKTTKPTQTGASAPKKTSKMHAKEFTFMRSPNTTELYQVGDAVDAFCDHEKNGERVRGWLKGIVVQIDNNKMVAVQFRSSVYLTDGWMVPDHILWFPTNSDQIRQYGTGKRVPLIKKNIEEF